MNCNEPTERLSAYADGALEPGERAAVEAHVERCAACRATLEDYRSIGRAIRGLARVSAPPSILSGVREAIAPAPLRFPLRGVLMPAAAAALLVALSVWIFTHGPPPAPRGSTLALDEVDRHAPVPPPPTLGKGGVETMEKNLAQEAGAAGFAQTSEPSPREWILVLADSPVKKEPAYGDFERRLGRTQAPDPAESKDRDAAAVPTSYSLELTEAEYADLKKEARAAGLTVLENPAQPGDDALGAEAYYAKLTAAPKPAARGALKGADDKLAESRRARALAESDPALDLRQKAAEPEGQQREAKTQAVPPASAAPTAAAPRADAPDAGRKEQGKAAVRRLRVTVYRLPAPPAAAQPARPAEKPKQP
jgi:hypothetical protein